MREPVLFLPGAFADRRLFAHQLDHLEEVATARFVDLPDRASAEAMADAVLAAAPERFAVVGLSLGGIVACEIQRRAAIACPTRVVCGRDDAVTSLERHRALAAALPTARLAVVEQAGRLVSPERPVATTTLLRDGLLYAG